MNKCHDPAPAQTYRRLRARAAHRKTIAVPTELMALLQRYATHGPAAAAN